MPFDSSIVCLELNIHVAIGILKLCNQPLSC